MPNTQEFAHGEASDVDSDLSYILGLGDSEDLSDNSDDEEGDEEVEIGAPVIPSDSGDICNHFLENAVLETIDNTEDIPDAWAEIRRDVNDAIDYQGGDSISSSENLRSIHDNCVDTHEDDVSAAYNSPENSYPPQDYAAFDDFCMQCWPGPSVNDPSESGAVHDQKDSPEAAVALREELNMTHVEFPMLCEHSQAGRPEEPPKAIKSDASFPLRQWINHEKTRSIQQDGLSIHSKASILRKLTVAYGIGKLIESCNDPIDSITKEDNFIVRETYH